MQKPSRVKRGLTCSRLYDFQPAILSTNKKVNNEGRRFLYNDNLFVLVRYPHVVESEFWAETLDLTLLAIGENEVFGFQSNLLISLQADLGLVGAPEDLVFRAESQFVIAADELPVLCRSMKKLDNEGEYEKSGLLSWMELVLRMFPSYLLGVDAFVNTESSSRSPRSLPQQRKLLEPFATLHSIMNLKVTDVNGKTQYVDAQLAEDVKESARRLDSMGEILDESTKIKERGNEAFRAGDFTLADSLYKLAMDNLDTGRRYLSQGSKEGVPGDMPELTYFRAHFSLALRICSNSVAALLRLRQWEAAHEKATEAIGKIKLAEKEISLDPGVVAKLYYRRALASKGMEEIARGVEGRLDHEDEGDFGGVEVAGGEPKTGASGVEGIDDSMAAVCISMMSPEHQMS